MKKSESALKNAGYLLLAVIIGLPHFLLSLFSVPGADDFSSLNAIAKLRESHNALVSALIYSYDNCMSWQGTYTGWFLMGIEPDVRDSFTGIRIVLFVGVALFIAAILFLVNTVCRVFFGFSSSRARAAALLTEFIVFNISVTGELFSWYTGASVYLFPLISMLLCLSFSIMSFHDRKPVYAVLSAVFGFIGSGGSLEVTGFCCISFLVLVTVYTFMTSGIKSRKKLLAFLYSPFLITVAGALMNALAPGNFKRHGMMGEADGSLNIVSSLMYSFINLISHEMFLIMNYLLPLILGLIFLLALYAPLKMRISGKAFAASAAAALIIPFVTCFPVLLGYSASNIDTISQSERVIYVFDLSIVLSIIFFDIIAAFYFRGILEGRGIKLPEILNRSLPVIAVIMILFSGTLLIKSGNGMSMRIIENLKNHEIQVATAQVKSIYDAAENADEGADVVLYEEILSGGVIYIPQYVHDPDYFANIEVARFYNIGSLEVRHYE